MLNKYPSIRESYEDVISNAVIFSNGAISYEDAWMLSGAELKKIQKVIGEKIELSGSTLGGI